MDSRFSIVPHEAHLEFRGSAIRRGDPHKQIQVRKTLEYLIRRYPDQKIVYNLQTIGDVSPKVQEILQLELHLARKLQASLDGAGTVEIIVRAAANFSIE